MHIDYPHISRNQGEILQGAKCAGCECGYWTPDGVRPPHIAILQIL